MKKIVLCLIIAFSLFFASACPKSNATIQETVDKYFSVEQLDNENYIYSVCNKNNEVAFRSFSTKYAPTAELVDGDLLEIKQYAGTGLWYTQYFNIETKLLSAWFECGRYLADDTVAYFIGAEESQVNLVLSNVFGKSAQVIKCDFSVSSANISDCIISVQSIGNSQIEIIYLDALGEMVTTVVNGDLQP